MSVSSIIVKKGTSEKSVQTQEPPKTSLHILNSIASGLFPSFQTFASSAKTVFDTFLEALHPILDGIKTREEALKIIDDWEWKNENTVSRMLGAGNTFLRWFENPEGCLCLQRLALTSLPDIFHLEPFKSKIDTLDLGHIQLADLPESFTCLHNLRFLSLRYTQLKDLPASFGKLTKLQHLDLHGTCLESLPDSILNLSPDLEINLQSCKLPYNVLKKFRQIALSEGYQGPRLIFPVDPLEKALSKHCEDIKIDKGNLSNLLDSEEPFRTHLTRWLDSLEVSNMCSTSKTRSDFYETIAHYLRLAETHPEFRGQFFSLPEVFDRDIRVLKPMRTSIEFLPDVVFKLRGFRIDLRGCSISEDLLDRVSKIITKKGYKGPKFFHPILALKKKFSMVYSRTGMDEKNLPNLLRVEETFRESLMKWLIQLGETHKDSLFNKDFYKKIAWYLELAEHHPELREHPFFLSEFFDSQRGIRLFKPSSLLLDSLPDPVFKLRGFLIDLEACHLSEDVLDKIIEITLADGYEGPTFILPPASQNTLKKAHVLKVMLERVYDKAEINKEDLSNLLKLRDPFRQYLLTWLDRLTWTSDNRVLTKPERRKEFYALIIEDLRLANVNVDFREGVFRTIVAEASDTCGDRISLSILVLGVQRRLIQLDKSDLKAVVKLLKGLLILSLLEDVARAKVKVLEEIRSAKIQVAIQQLYELNPNPTPDDIQDIKDQFPEVDGVEVYLAYPVALKGFFAIPIDVESMLYFTCSKIEEEDITEARTYVESSLNNQEVIAEYLISREEWKSSLAITYPKRCQKIENTKVKASKLVDEESSDYCEQYNQIDIAYKGSLKKLTLKVLSN